MVIDPDTGTTRGFTIRNRDVKRAVLKAAREEENEAITMHVTNSKRTSISVEERERLLQMAQEQMGPDEPGLEPDKPERTDEPGPAKAADGGSRYTGEEGELIGA